MERKKIPYVIPMAQSLMLLSAQPALLAGSPTGENYENPIEYDGFGVMGGFDINLF